ncbi:hypothetical protein AMELA_G00199310 [Ameiurus melas]|uniref:Reelin domain-containing protein n=1 Tax=Ameiurus melas TaxID=219545 RepID=A0A7J6A6H2_AMEME|nr:hypothetical protein AMELA_G00199310 [Ameiurus melas]
MGLLLHARSVAEDRVVEGEFTIHPPGTHTLSCLSTADTVTHSDKLLKRNLSFTWRAPARPSGDLRFYITVVHSYFVYWTRIQSAVVHDGTHKPPTGHDAGLQDRIVSALHVEPSAALQRSLSDPVEPWPDPDNPVVFLKPTDPKPHPESGIKTGGGVKTKAGVGLVSQPVLLLVLSLALLVALAVYVQRKHCVQHSGASLSVESAGVRHVQECGELVQLRRVRENSLLWLQAQYDIVTAPGN